jgi:hypothetical protein
MDRMDWMYVRALAPSCSVLAFALALALILQRAGASPFLATLAGFTPWVFLGGIAVAVLLAIAPMYRLWQWQQAEGLMCPNCAGLLGDLVDGRYGPYYKCLRCGANIAARRVH